jgi:hypothetical protein
MSSVEKRRLCAGFQFVSKVAQADAYKAVVLLRGKVYSFSQIQCDLCQFFARG